MAALLTNQTEDGAGDWVAVDVPSTMVVSGTFDGATVVLEGRDPEIQANSAPAETYTSPRIHALTVTNAEVRVSVKNAGAATDISASVF